MKTSIVTVSLSGGLRDKLEAIAGAGFDGVEIFEDDLLSYSGSPGEVRRIVADLGLAIVTYQPFRDFEGMPADMRDGTFARAERAFDVMEELGCDFLLVCSNVSPAARSGIERAGDDLRALGERAAKRGMRVGFEALSWGRHINDYRESWEVVRRADHPAVGLVLDAFHILARGSDLGAIRSLLPDKVWLVQVSDAPYLDRDYLSWSRGHRCLPGEGSFALVDYLEAVRSTGYVGPVSLEIFRDQSVPGDVRADANEGHRALMRLLDGVKARTVKAKDVR